MIPCNSASAWNCPVCGLSLMPQEKRLLCDNGHSFDQAREGYVNLLLANHKQSTQPGDDRTMLRARRAFLDGGYYQPLAQHLADLLRQLRQSQSRCRFNLLDCGCGEGYYTHWAHQALTREGAGQSEESDLLIRGVDISKEAIRMAARRYPLVEFAVASSHRLPLHENAIDCLMSVFSPLFAEEILRLLKPRGVLLNVRPGPHHLMGLREQVYDNPHPHQEKQLDLQGLRLLRRESLSYEITPDRSSLSHLLAMTPYYWQVSREKKQQIEQIESLTTPVDFIIEQFVLS